MFYSVEETEMRKASVAVAVLETAQDIRQHGHTMSPEQAQAVAERVGEFIATSGPGVPSEMLADIVRSHMFLVAAEVLGHIPDAEPLAYTLELTMLGAYALRVTLETGGYPKPTPAHSKRFSSTLARVARELAAQHETVTREQARERMNEAAAHVVRKAMGAPRRTVN